MFAKISLAVVTVFGCSAFAAGKMEIKQIDTVQRVAAINSNGNAVTEGNTLVVTGKDGSQCGLPVRSVNGSIVIADISGCHFSNSLRVGQTADLSMINDLDSPAAVGQAPAPRALPTPPPVTASAPSYPAAPTHTAAPVMAYEPVRYNNSRNGSSSSVSTRIAQAVPAQELSGFSLFAYQSMADTFEGTGMVYQGSQADITLSSHGAPGVMGEYAQMNPEAFGFYVNASYEGKREWRKISAHTLGSANFKKAPKLTLAVFGAGLNYQMTNNFYFLGGLNYNLPTIDDVQEYAYGTTRHSETGKVGYEVGAGLRFLNQFQAQIVYRKVTMAISNDVYGVDELNSAGYVLRGGHTF